NTARGAIVDEAALLAALEDGRVGAAGLDVFEEEPQPLRALVDHSGVVSTPHSAAFSEQALRRLFSAAAEDVVRVLCGQPPAYPAPLMEEMHGACAVPPHAPDQALLGIGRRAREHDRDERRHDARGST